MKSYKEFINDKFGEIRVVVIENHNWFMGKDIVKALGYNLEGKHSYTEYINKELDYGFYRELNSDSEFRLSFPNGMQWYTKCLNNSTFEFINIGYNLNILSFYLLKSITI